MLFNLLLFLALKTMASSTAQFDSIPRVPTNNYLRVAAAQFDSIPHVPTNVLNIKRLVAQASANSSHAVAFPETALTSYNATYIHSLSPNTIRNAISDIQAQCKQYQIYCIIGTPWWSATGVRQNAAVVIDSQGNMLGHQPKTMLVGDDLSWAAPGQAIRTFNMTIDRGSSKQKTYMASIIICHDVRFAELVRLPVLRGARVVFYISWEQDDYASGLFPPQDQQTYLANVQARAFENRIYVVHSNAPKNVLHPAVGSHGQSCIISPIGRVLSKGPEVGEALVMVALNMTASTAGYAKEELLPGRYLQDWWNEGMLKYVSEMNEFAVATTSTTTRTTTSTTTPSTTHTSTNTTTSTTTCDIRIDTSFVMHTIDEKFVSYTIDSSRWRKIDFNNQTLVFMAQQLSPAIFRVGGTQGDYDVYLFGESGKDFDCAHPPSPMTSYRCQTVNNTQWTSLVHFAKQTKASLVFGLNDLYGRPTKTIPETPRCNNGLCPPRNQSNLKDFLTWTVAHLPLDAVYGWELGNELNDYFNGDTGAVTQSNDFRALRTLVDSLYNGSNTPLVIGPDTHSSTEYSRAGQHWLNTFAKAAFFTDAATAQPAAAAVDVVTFHMYSMGNGPNLDPNALNTSFLNKTHLDKSGVGAKTVVDIVKHAHQQSGIDRSNSPGIVWAGETAAANDGGQGGITDTWIDGFWYLDELGSHAANNVQVNCRQTLYTGESGGYALIGQFPLPDYWLALLFKQIMGNRVLNVTSVSRTTIRMYSHCAVQGGVAIAWLNIGEQEETLAFHNGMDTSDGLLWLLQPGAQMPGTSNKMQSQEVRLNGVVLKLDGLTLPNLNGKNMGKETIQVPGASYGFIVFPKAGEGVCSKIRKVGNS